MTAALDLGCSEFRSLRRENQRLIARRLAAVYTQLDDQEDVRRVLEQSFIPYSAVSGSLIVVGDAAKGVSKLFSRPLVSLLDSGEIDETDLISRQVCAWMIDLLLPFSQQANELCMLTLPRGINADQSGESWTAQFLEHVIQLQGYETEVMHPATATCLAELEDVGFTGIGLTIGAEAITFSMTLHSRPILELRSSKGSTDVIERFAHAHKKYVWDASGNSYLDLPSVYQWMAERDVSLLSPETAEEKWLRDAYEELLLSAWFSFKRKIVHCHESILNQTFPIVLSGAASQLQGFPDLVLESLRLSGIPITPSEIRVATFEPYSVARGLLIQAELTAGKTAGAFFESDAA